MDGQRMRQVWGVITEVRRERGTRDDGQRNIDQGLRPGVWSGCFGMREKQG